MTKTYFFVAEKAKAASSSLDLRLRITLGVASARSMIPRPWSIRTSGVGGATIVTSSLRGHEDAYDNVE